jgi:hypothetical protein
MSLFDHLVGERKHLVRNRESKSLGGLTIDHKLEFGRLQHGQIGGLFAPENATNITADLAVRIRKTASRP